MRMAMEKAMAGREMVSNGTPILAADTEVIIDDEILGKPVDDTDAIAMLQKLSGRTHNVYSAVALLNGGKQCFLNRNLVSFRPLTFEECQAYCATGEPFDKAGAYAIQGRAAAFISRIEGSYSGIMGLPLFETAELLETIKT